MASSSGPSLNEELQCSICLEVFTDPVTTPCGHSFCRTCLSKCWPNSPICFCPLCKEIFSRRPNLKINTTLREVVRHFKEKLNPGESEVFCDFCGERKQKAVKTCLTCQSSYCDSHLEPHLRVPRLKKHTLINTVPIEEDRMKKIQEITRSEQRKTLASNDCFLTSSQTVHNSNWMIIGLGVLLVATLIYTSICHSELLKMEDQQKAAEKQAEDLSKELHQEINEQKRRNTDLEQEITEQRRRNTDLEQEITEQRRRNTELKRRNTDLEQDIYELNRINTDLSQTVVFFLLIFIVIIFSGVCYICCSPGLQSESRDCAGFIYGSMTVTRTLLSIRATE